MAKQFSIYAAPLAYGPKVQIQSVFGANVWCSFTVTSSQAGGPVVFKCWTSTFKNWKETVPGQIIKGQSVWLSAKSTGTGGAVEIAVKGTAISVAVAGLPLLIKGLPSTTMRSGMQAFELEITPEGGNPVVVEPNDQTNVDSALGAMEDKDGNPVEAVTIEFPSAVENTAGATPGEGPNGPEGPDGGGPDGPDDGGPEAPDGTGDDAIVYNVTAKLVLNAVDQKPIVRSDVAMGELNEPCDGINCPSRPEPCLNIDCPLPPEPCTDESREVQAGKVK